MTEHPSESESSTEQVEDNYVHHEEEAISLEAVGSVGNKEKEDKEMQLFEQMLNKKKRRKKRKKKSKKTNSNDSSSKHNQIKEDLNYFNHNDCRDYPYTILLDRIFRQLREKNPNLVAIKDRMNLPPLSISFIGGKKTGWGNFKTICERINRPIEHVKQFFLTEMNTTGNLLKNGGLIFKGRWMNKQIESLLQKYRKLYITCENCRSAKTTLTKDSSTRLFFLKCDVCSSSRSVTNIKGGFRAATREDRRNARFGR